MEKLLNIKNQYKISYREISQKINDLWETTTSVSNLHKIFNEKTGLEIITLYKILSAFNHILKSRGFDLILTPNDVLDYEDNLF